ncbi:MAG: tetratricopeptide repeat protein [bacterium]|nr:tetratricopeptide repeat protein [bacterium]
MTLHKWLMAPTQQAVERKDQVAARQAPAQNSPQTPKLLSAAQTPMLTGFSDFTVKAPPDLPLPQPLSAPREEVSQKPARSQVNLTPSTALKPLHTQTRPQAQILFQQAVRLQENGQILQTVTLLQQAVKLDSTFKEARNKLGNLYYKQQKYHQALAHFQQVLKIDPDDVKARNNLGSTYLKLEMDEEAREALHQAVNTDYTYGLAYYNLACVYARAGDSVTAVQYLRHAMTIEPRARNWAQTDADFTRVRNTPELRQLLGSS